MNPTEKHRETARLWNKTHPEGHCAHNKKYAKLHSARVKARRAKTYARDRERLLAEKKEYYKKERERIRRRFVERKYGLTPDQHDTMLKEQKYRCAFPDCGLAVTIYSPIDHRHSDDKVRGVLCINHNLGLGHFEKLNPKCLLNAYAYLEK